MEKADSSASLRNKQKADNNNGNNDDNNNDNDNNNKCTLLACGGVEDAREDGVYVG